MKQMVFNFLICVLIVGAIYSLSFPDSRIAATASAVRQIWSGSCRLSCLQSEFSGFSGLSGLLPGQFQDKTSSYVARSSVAGPSSSCVCESCPCALIENVLRTCRPATTIYLRAVDIIAACWYAILEMLHDMYKYMERVIDCRTSCQRRPQLIETQDSGSDVIYFGNKKNRDFLDKGKAKIKKSDSALKLSKSIVFKDVSDADITKSTPDTTGSRVGASDATLRPREDERVTSGEVNSCPRCVEQGKICMKNCPKAYVKNTRK